MNTHKIKAFLGVALLAASGCATSRMRPAQLDAPVTTNVGAANMAADNLMAVLWIQRSAEYRALCYQAFNTASEKLAAAVSAHDDPAALCIVLDVDETVLDNSAFQAQIVRDDGVYSRAGWSNWTAGAAAVAIPGAAEFLKNAERMGVEIFYISNRETNELAPTLKNMRAVGFPHADAAHLKLRSSKEDTKEKRRLELNKEVILLLGDNLADFHQVFEGGSITARSEAADKNRERFGRRFIVLPNPMYGDWEAALYGYDQRLTPEEKALRRRGQLRVR